MQESDVLRRLLWAMAALCLVVGLIAIPVVGDDGQVEAGRGSAGRRGSPAEVEGDEGAEADAGPADGGGAAVPAGDAAPAAGGVDAGPVGGAPSSEGGAGARRGSSSMMPAPPA